MVNRVILMGYLGKDPEVRRLENGASVAKFTLATSESYRDKNNEWQENTEWHNVVAWRSLAERAESSLRKGSLVYLEGKLTHRSYQDSENVTKYITEVVANYFRLVPQKNEGSGGGGSSYPRSAETTPKAKEGREPETSYAGESDHGNSDNKDTDDLPF